MKPGGFERERTGREGTQSILAGHLNRRGSDGESPAVALLLIPRLAGTERDRHHEELKLWNHDLCCRAGASTLIKGHASV